MIIRVRESIATCFEITARDPRQAIVNRDQVLLENHFMNLAPPGPFRRDNRLGKITPHRLFSCFKFGVIKMYHYSVRNENHANASSGGKDGKGNFCL